MHPPEEALHAHSNACKSSSQVNAGIYYFPDGFDTGRQKLMGRHAAGEEFLKAWARFSDVDPLFCYARSREHLQHFMQRTKGLGNENRKTVWVPWQNWQGLTAAGCLFLPGPGLGPLAYQRRHFGNRSVSLCGITHTTASDNVMDALGEMLVAPVQAWDAVICTSQAVKQMVTTVLASQASYLANRFQLTAVPESPLQLPVIPLGVNCDAFAVGAEKRLQLRKAWRQKLQLTEDHFVVLYMGRLSFHAKAHPMPVYRGLEVAARQTGKPICLVMAGWFANESIKKEFIETAKAFAPSVKTIFVDGRHKEVRESIWFAADIFTSLSDNVQETFGLTPVEAMAAGLPAVVSDWDGYKETVRHGVDGFLVPTYMAAPGSANDLALANAMGAITYDQYIGFHSQYTSVDVAACTQAYIRLVEDSELRAAMGAAAQRRARDTFDWRIIIKSYQELFADLALLRQSAGELAPKSPGEPAQPLRQDFTVLFQGYPSNHLTPDTYVKATQLANPENLKQLRQYSMNFFGIERVLPAVDLEALLAKIHSQSPCRFEQLLQTSDQLTPQTLSRIVLWMAKMGLVNLGRGLI
jgi:alpha-maltose-1-phosphate synthase